MSTTAEDEYDDLLQEMEDSKTGDPSAPTLDGLDRCDMGREGTEEPSRRKKSSRPRSSDLSDEEDQIEGSSPLSRSKRARVDSPTMATPSTMQDGNLTQFIAQVISGRKLRQSSVSELNLFAKASPAQREIMQFALSLEIRYIQKNDLKTMDEVWVVPPKLLKNAQRYCTVFTFAPNAVAYKTGVHNAVLKALRNNKIEGMPPEADRSKNETLGAKCKKYLSDNRADLKKPLEKSVEKYEEMMKNGTFAIGDSELDIGHVALEVFKGYKDIHPTPAHLGRLAWLRHLIASGKVSAGENFWDGVDKKLAELRDMARKKSPSNPTAYTDKVFKAVFDKDQRTYGKAKLDALTSLTQLPIWQRNVEETAGNL